MNGNGNETLRGGVPSLNTLRSCFVSSAGVVIYTSPMLGNVDESEIDIV